MYNFLRDLSEKDIFAIQTVGKQQFFTFQLFETSQISICFVKLGELGEWLKPTVC